MKWGESLPDEKEYLLWLENNTGLVPLSKLRRLGMKMDTPTLRPLCLCFSWTCENKHSPWQQKQRQLTYYD